jgi:hypothetical protein
LSAFKNYEDKTHQDEENIRQAAAKLTQLKATAKALRVDDRKGVPSKTTSLIYR